jgi:hypothetical protein
MATTNELTTIKVTAADFRKTHAQLVKLLKALDKAGPNGGLSTRKLCEQVLNSKAYARKNSLIDQAVALGYITRKKVKRPKGLVGNPLWTVNFISPKGKQLLDQLH